MEMGLSLNGWTRMGQSGYVGGDLVTDSRTHVPRQGSIVPAIEGKLSICNVLGHILEHNNYNNHIMTSGEELPAALLSSANGSAVATEQHISHHRRAIVTL